MHGTIANLLGHGRISTISSRGIGYLLIVAYSKNPQFSAQELHDVEWRKKLFNADYKKNTKDYKNITSWPDTSTNATLDQENMLT